MSIFPVYVGLDYHDESIRVCVLSQEGDALVNRDVPNSPGLVEELVLCYGVPRGVGRSDGTSGLCCKEPRQNGSR